MKSRKELYAEVKRLGIEEVIKNKTGRNFTQVSSECLSDIIDSYSKDVFSTSTGPILRCLVKILAEKRILLKSEVEKILSC